MGSRILFTLVFFIITGEIGYTYSEPKHIPMLRGYYSTIYDSSRKQIIIFGGENDGGFLSDTWILDMEKKKWEEIKTEKKPPARRRHSAIYDSTNKQMIVFGGMNNKGKCLSDIWVFDIERKTWEEIASAEGPGKGTKDGRAKETPSGRMSHSAIYDPVNKQMIVFGGMYGKNSGPFICLPDTWVFDIEKKTWKEIETEETPNGRASHTAIYDSANKQMIIFGGYGQGCRSDIWVFDIEKKTWKEIEEEGPPKRESHRAIYDSINKQMIILGGMDHEMNSIFFLRDIWAFDIEKETWEEIDTKKTLLSLLGSVVYDSTNKQLISLDSDGQTKQLSKIWTFDIEKKTWKEDRIRGVDTKRIIDVGIDLMDIKEAKPDNKGNNNMGIMRNKELATRENLSAIRGAITIYYGKTKGKWPESLTIKKFKEHLFPIPPERITDSNKVVNKFDGTGGWYYNSESGEIFLNLKGTDSRGSEYSNY